MREDRSQASGERLSFPFASVAYQQWKMDCVCDWCVFLRVLAFYELRLCANQALISISPCWRFVSLACFLRVSQDRRSTSYFQVRVFFKLLCACMCATFVRLAELRVRCEHVCLLPGELRFLCSVISAELAEAGRKLHSSPPAGKDLLQSGLPFARQN